MSIIEVTLAVWCFLVAFGGGLVGLVLGNMRLPLVVLLAASPAVGAGTNIAISTVAAGSASVSHIRAGRINWRLFGWMLPPSVLGAVIGGYLSGLLPGQLLMAVIGLVLLYSGVDLLRWHRPKPKPEQATESPKLNIRSAVGIGFVVGLLGGVVGLILGSLRMPALLRVVGEQPARAVGTNLTVGVAVGIAGVIGHLPSHAPDWRIVAIGAIASIPGALLGARLTGRLSEQQLIKAIGSVLLVAAVGCFVQALG